jgi:large subunit ribosomal protein L35Ae
VSKADIARDILVSNTIKKYYCIFRNYVIDIFFACSKTACPGHEKASRIRVIWGKITRSHGSSGIVRAKFKKNLPAVAMGRRIRVVGVVYSLSNYTN